MASTKVMLKHSTSILLKEAPFGFSWTTLFFGFFPALFRGDIKWGIIQLVLSCLTFGISWFVFPFIYNSIYARGLLENGYLPADEGGISLLASRGIMLATSVCTDSQREAQRMNQKLKQMDMDRKAEFEGPRPPQDAPIGAIWCDPDGIRYRLRDDGSWIHPSTGLSPDYR